MAGFLESIGSGAAGGAALGPWGAAGGALLGVAPTLIQLLTGGSQRRRAAAINPVDPGYVQNQGILDNKQIVNNKYNNYTLPGKTGILNNLQGSFANGINAIENAATSSEDILGGVTDLNFNQNQSLLDLGIKEASMKDSLLPSVLEANAAAGNEAVLENRFREQRYQQDLARKADLEVSGATNQYKAFDNFATLGGSLLNYRSEPLVNGQYKRKPLESYNKARGL